MLNYAIKQRHAYDRWKTIVNVLILKDPGNFKIHRLRIIHLFECDYNFMLGLKWKDALHQAQQSKTLNDSQYGSRPGRDLQTNGRIKIGLQQNHSDPDGEYGLRR